MKKYLYIFCMAALASCIGEESLMEYKAGSVDSEKPTYATLNVAITDPATRGDLIGDMGESDAISSIRILVYKDDDNALNGVCEADLLVMAPSGQNAATLLVTAGWKRILVIVNDYSKPWKFPNQAGKTLNQLISTWTSASEGKLTLNEVDFGTPSLAANAPLASIDYSSIAGPSNFIYSNSLADSSSRKWLKGGIPSTEAQAGARGESDNHFTIYVKRSVAKVTVSYEGSDYTIDQKGTLSDLTWGVRNQNRAVALFQIPSPSEKPQAPFFRELMNWTFPAVDNSANYRRFWWGDGDINIPLLNGGLPTKFYYIPENANNTIVSGNTTYVIVKGTFTPAANTVVTEFTSNFPSGVTSVKKESIETGKTFYRLVGIAGTNGGDNIDAFSNGWIQNGDIFLNEDDARKMAFIAEHQGSSIGYTPGYVPTTVQVDAYQNGICYYRVDIRNGSNRWVERNKAYHGHITSFSTLGEPGYPDLDRIQLETYVTANISVIPWEHVDFNEDM
ncbi:hypothetical protein FACS1894181_15840 [Bacteroidia bacterium]|nr:hypothetical protein FACS1894181_15840 [Bacteroidia bacterium]